MAKLFLDVFSWGEGSRRAQWCALTVGAIAAFPEFTWPLVAVCAIFVAGRTAHDVALARNAD